MITYIGRSLLNIQNVALDLSFLILQTLFGCLTPPYRIKDIIKQSEFVTWGSVVIVVFCVCAAAMVTILEASFHMKIVIKDDSMVPGFAAILILRELGAIVTALLVTSRVGAGIAAEVSSMQVTEQIDALKMLGIDPIRFIVVPRFIACTFGVAILSLIANVVCIYAAMWVSEIYLGFTSGLFLTGMVTFVKFRDLIFAGIKGAAFGSVIPIISCFFGFRCKAGAEGVGLATTNSVVASSVTIIIIDFILSFVFSFYY